MLERLITRRGLEVRTIWQSVTRQDEDTSIDGLVEIERETGHQFEFYMHPYAANPICASTAKAYAAAGGELYHSVTVYEATLKFPTRLKHLFEVLSKPEYAIVRDTLDLAESNPIIAEERFTVVPAIVDYLDSITGIPYGDTAGERDLLARLASFMHRYYLLPLQQENFLVAPSRADILGNLLHLYQPELVQCSAKLYDQLPWEWRDRSRLGSSLIYSPADLLLTRELLLRLKPEVVYIELSGADATHPERLEMLLAAANQVGALLILDISQLVELTSNPLYAVAFAHLSELGELPANLFLLCGFIRNQAYHDLQLSWVASQVTDNIAALADAAELSYSRTPILTQRYYTQILDELLHFLYPRGHVQEDFEKVIGLPQFEATRSSLILGRSEAAAKAFAHPAISGNHLAFDETSVRLDYGENELAIPMRLRSALMEIFLRERLGSVETGVEEGIAAQLEERFGIHSEYINDTVLGSGVAELFSAIVRVLKKGHAHMLLPQGAYGYFQAVLQYYSLPFTVVPTRRENSFKLAVKELSSYLAQLGESNKGGETWLYLNAPVSNPSGAIYSHRELKAILALCRERGVSVVMDTVFAGLEFPGFQNHWNIEESWQSFTKDERGTNLIILGGVAKEFEAAGLRFGYATAPRGEFLATMAQLVQPPHYTARYGVSALLKLYQCRDSESWEYLELQEYTKQQRSELAARCKLLSTTLINNGWQVLAPQGGLFLLATPVEFLGRAIRIPGESQPLLLDGDTIVQALFRQTGLAINGSSWIGIPDYCRFVFSCSPEQLDKALVRIVRFKRIFDESVI